MTIADKLTVLAASKEMVRLKLGIGEDVPFSEYSDHIGWDGITSDLGQSTTTAASQKLVTDEVDKTKEREVLLQDSIASLLKYTNELEDRLYKLTPYTPYQLFRINKNIGVWYDPSDMSTLFQDVAGTVPVTKNGDPVGLMLDKSGNGNHATQETASARPIYRSGDGRGWVNNLTNTEDFNKAGWSKTLAVGVSITNDVEPPIKNVNVQMVTATNEEGGLRISQQYNWHNVGTSFISSVYLKAGTYTHARLGLSQSSNATRSLTIDLTTGDYTHRLPTDDANFAHSVEHVGDGWYRVSITRKQTNYNLEHFVVYVTNYSGGSDTVTGSEEYRPKAGEYIYMAAPQLQIVPPNEIPTDNFVLQPYQANGSHIEGIATGLPTDLYWLEFDGVDDRLGWENYVKGTSVAIACSPSGNTTGVLGGGSNDLATGYIAVSAGGFRLRTYTTDTHVFTEAQAGTKVYSMLREDNGDVYAWRDGEESTNIFNKAGILLKYISPLNVYAYKGRVYGVAVSENLITRQQRDELEIYLANKSGVTL